MHRLRQEQPDFGDPVPIVAHTIAAETRVLCFDEFQVTDVADALVIRRLFRHLFAHGLVMVATSNRPPSQLYLHGVQREHFVPFIDDLNERCECHDLESPTDYRMLAHVSSGARMYLHPLDETTAAEVSQLVSQSVRRPVSQSWSRSPWSTCHEIARLAQASAMFSDFAKGRVEKRTLRLRTRELQAPRCREDCTEIALEHARRACRPGAASWRDGSGRQVHLPRAVWTAARCGAAHASVRELRT